MADQDIFNMEEKRTNYIQIAAAIVIIAAVAAGAYYYLSLSAPAQQTTTISVPSNSTTTIFRTMPYGPNSTAKWNDINANGAYMLNTSYISSSTVNYSQVQATQYQSPLYYGPGMITAYDSMIGVPQFEAMYSNSLPVDNFTAAHPNTIMEMWAYTGTFNTSANAQGMLNYTYNGHTNEGQSVPTYITPAIGSNSILLSYNSISGEFSSLNLYMVLFVKGSTFVQIGAWVSKNSTPDQVISIAREYGKNLP